jgi:hypothetical protein
VRSLVLEVAGDEAGAAQAVEEGLRQVPDDVGLLRQLAHLSAQRGDAARSLTLAQRAAQIDFGPGSRYGLCEALLAAGRIREADALAAQLCAVEPLNQYAIALQATAWRLLDDPRYHALYDYEHLVSARKLDTPPGWTNLDAFLRELALELEGMHTFQTHPLQNSVRGGSQLTLDPPELARPLIAALFERIASAVADHVGRIGPGAGPFRSRNTGQFVFSGAWSVRLRSGGYHTDHVHPDGWLSSACYIALPPTIGRGEASKRGRDGWLRLGHPLIRTGPPLQADHYVKPEPGLLVLFPAYMWHGVELFESEEPRLSVAFDVVPS